MDRGPRIHTTRINMPKKYPNIKITVTGPVGIGKGHVMEYIVSALIKRGLDVKHVKEHVLKVGSLRSLLDVKTPIWGKVED